MSNCDSVETIVTNDAAIKEPVLYEGERIDDLQRDGLMIIQNKDKFCFGTDAVLLADFAKAKRGEQVLDIGTGTGIIPILMTSKTAGEHFTGLEIQTESARMAARSVDMNNLNDKVSIVEGDINDACNLFKKESFHVITSNPPYMIEAHGADNDDEPIAIARHEIKCTLDDVIREGAALLKANGRFYMIHRPFRLTEIMDTFRKYGLEPKRMRLIHPYIDKEPTMVLIEALKGGHSGIKIMPPLIMYDAPGRYTKEISVIYGTDK